MTLETKLYAHQKKAVEKLISLRVGALFMEQGTGKTRTALEMIKIRLDAQKINHVIWLCPCSVKENLRRDIIKHTGELPDCITICGIETLSTSYRWNKKLNDLAEAKKSMLIVDESSKVKNFIAKRTKNIITLSQKCYYRIVMNGTPVTRNEVDLFAQMYILDWRILGYKSLYGFAANHIEYDEYGKARRCLNIDYLTDKIALYSYQIKKSECLSLPPKTYETVFYDMTEEQNEHYEKVKNIFLDRVDEFDETTLYRLFTALQLVISGKHVHAIMKTKKVRIEETRFVPEHWKEIQYLSGIEKKDFFDNIEDNPRIQILLDIIKDIDSKCIIFCKYTDEIINIHSLLSKYGYSSAVYHGGVSLRQRDNNIDNFRNDVQFLIANKTCAGFGLNLQFCSYVIFYSNDFDYGTRAQAEDRVHRLGQAENVHIIDICANNKFDEKIIDCLTKKENLLDSIRNDLNDKRDKKEELESLLYIPKNHYTKAKRKYVNMSSLDKSDLKEET